MSEWFTQGLKAVFSSEACFGLVLIKLASIVLYLITENTGLKESGRGFIKGYTLLCENSETTQILLLDLVSLLIAFSRMGYFKSALHKKANSASFNRKLFTYLGYTTTLLLVVIYSTFFLSLGGHKNRGLGNIIFSKNAGLKTFLAELNKLRRRNEIDMIVISLFIGIVTIGDCVLILLGIRN